MTDVPGEGELDAAFRARLSWRGKLIVTVLVLLAGQLLATFFGWIAWLNNVEDIQHGPRAAFFGGVATAGLLFSLCVLWALATDTPEASTPKPAAERTGPPGPQRAGSEEPAPPDTVDADLAASLTPEQ